jgi:DNA repair protein RadC
MKDRDTVTADELVAGAKKLQKLQLYKVKLVKDRALAFAVTEIGSSGALAKIARSELSHLPHEEVLAIGLGGRNNILGVVKVSQGGLHGAAITAVDVIRPLIAMGASAFVLAHNHPSGDPTPSREDKHMTDALKKAGDCVGLALLDHLIIGNVRGGALWNSMRDMGMM